MPAEFEIRALFDAETIVVYQAYTPQIARAAVKAGRFVPPFSVQRMTWIKPSFLWMMHRSNWAQSTNQESVLAIRILRSGWEAALSQAALSWFAPSVHGTYDAWQARLEVTPVRVQWDPERSLTDERLPYRSIQVGLGRQVVPDYVQNWIVSIDDITPRVRELHALVQASDFAAATAMLPIEQVYPLPAEIGRPLLLN